MPGGGELPGLISGHQAHHRDQEPAVAARDLGEAGSQGAEPGGADHGEGVKQRILEVFPTGTVWEFYGASEGGGTRIGPDEWLARPGSVGRPWPGLDVKALDDDGAPCAPGQVGTIYLKLSPGASFSYSGADEKTRAAFRDGYFTVGDMGYLDADGYLSLVGRLKEMINRGGEKIATREIDDVLLLHPAVGEGVAFGSPHPAWGEEVVAAVVLKGEATEKELIAFARERLADYKVPRTIEFHAALPREGEAPLEAEALDAVRLMTIHRAKGLEWDAVALPSLEEGLLPIRQAGEDAAALDLARCAVGSSARNGRPGARQARRLSECPALPAWKLAKDPVNCRRLSELDRAQRPLLVSQDGPPG